METSQRAVEGTRRRRVPAPRFSASRSRAPLAAGVLLLSISYTGMVTRMCGFDGSGSVSTPNMRLLMCLIRKLSRCT